MRWAVSRGLEKYERQQKKPINKQECKNNISLYVRSSCHVIISHHHNGKLADRRPRNVLDLRSLIWGFRNSCTIVHGITSQSANVFSNVLSLDIFVDLQPIDCSLKRALFDPQFGVNWEDREVRISYLARP